MPGAAGLDPQPAFAAGFSFTFQRGVQGVGRLPTRPRCKVLGPLNGLDAP